MKATLTFNLPEDARAHENAAKGTDWYCFAWELDQKVRAKLKYEDLSAEERLAYETVRDWILAGLDDNGLRIHDGQ